MAALIEDGRDRLRTNFHPEWYCQHCFEVDSMVSGLILVN